MIKQKTFNIADTNIANLGSDLERNIKKASAEGEPAWEGSGEEVGIEIWRIENFRVVRWPLDQYGNFFSGDSYIVLNTWKEEGHDALKMDVHFWLGQDTTQDEAGTAAYKTVELDTLHNDVPIQHREVEGYESPKFLGYFDNYGGLVTMEGGAESGFHHVEIEDYKPRLLHCKGKYNNKIRVTQVPLTIESLNSGDVFVLDVGNKLFQFNGATSGIWERRKGGEIVQRTKEARGSKLEFTWVVDESSPDNDDAEFWEYFGGLQDIAEGTTDVGVESRGNRFYHLSDASGELEFNFLGEGTLGRDQLDSDDVYIIDAQHVIYIWIGVGASEEEKNQAMNQAQLYINEHHDGLPLSISLLQEQGVTNDQYRDLLGH